MYYDGSDTYTRGDGTENTVHYLRHNDRVDRMGRNLVRVPNDADIEGPLKKDELMEVELTVFQAQAQSKKNPQNMYTANCFFIQSVRPATAGLVDELEKNGKSTASSPSKAGS